MYWNLTFTDFFSMRDTASDKPFNIKIFQMKAWWVFMCTQLHYNNICYNYSSFICFCLYIYCYTFLMAEPNRMMIYQSMLCNHAACCILFSFGLLIIQINLNVVHSAKSFKSPPGCHWDFVHNYWSMSFSQDYFPLIFLSWDRWPLVDIIMVYNCCNPTTLYCHRLKQAYKMQITVY